MDWTNFKPVVDQILKSSGPWATLFVLVVLMHIRYVQNQAAARLADKDKEIERLVRERDQLQEIVLKKRRSSASE
jgi:hypothetical protein